MVVNEKTLKFPPKNKNQNFEKKSMALIWDKNKNHSLQTNIFKN